MNVLALVKYSLDVAEIKVDATTEELRLRGVPERFGDADKGVVEAAVRLQEAVGGTVQVMCLGPAAALSGVKDLLAMGADEATVVEAPPDAEMDAGVVAGVLEAAIRKAGDFDLVFCGFASDDGYTQQTGPRLAERLQRPLVSHVREIEARDGALTVVRDLEDRLETVGVQLPAVVTVAEEAFEARRVTLLQAMKAQKKPMTTWSLGDLGLTDEALGRLSTQSETSRKGIVVSRKQRVLKGDDLGALADQLIDVLLEENVVRAVS